MRTPESAGTIRTRRMHYLWYCHRMNWVPDLLLEGGDDDTALRGQYQMAMYALHLSSGNTIYCKRIKAATIEQYVFAAASFVAMFSGVDFRKDRPADKVMGHILSPVYRDLKKYESVPDRREPYSAQMHLLARQLVTEFVPESLIAALVDGFEQGYSAGYRLSEWAQPAGRSDPFNPQLNHLVSALVRTRALIPIDFRIITSGLHRAVGLSILYYPLLGIVKMFVKFRTQKNGQHGEERLFTRNPNPGGFCFISSVYRSLQRFRLIQLRDPRIDPSITPLSVYWDQPLGRARLVTSFEIDRFMRILASTVYHLDPVRHAADLQKWGSHSLRVGACVTLHAMGFSPLDIQFILRWRSMAFMVYLRNVAILANRHHQALDRAAAQPYL